MVFVRQGASLLLEKRRLKRTTRKKRLILTGERTIWVSRSSLLPVSVAVFFLADERVPINADLAALRAFDLDYSYGPAIGIEQHSYLYT